jgi:ubiquinone/menaquinone biosynthesis C-methylase UbiE
VLGGISGHYALSSGVIDRSVGLKPSDLVVDVGGGTGGVSAPLRAKVGGILVVEPSETLVRRGRRRHQRLAFAVGDGRALPLRDASVDAVLLVEVLHHVSDAAAVLAEAARVLRPGGSLLVEETEFGPGLVGRLRYWAERALSGGVWPRSRTEISARLAALGLRPRLLDHEGFVIVATAS